MSTAHWHGTTSLASAKPPPKLIPEQSTTPLRWTAHAWSIPAATSV